MNLGVGGKNPVIIRNGYYLRDGQEVQQSMYFIAGDVLSNRVKRNIECYNHVNKMVTRTTVEPAVGEVIAQGSELIGVMKGIV